MRISELFTNCVFQVACLVLMVQSQILFGQNVGPGGVGTSANMSFWLDASQLSLNDADPVATWTDMSGNGNDFSQGTGGNQPAFKAVGSIGGQPSVDFLGSDFMESSAVSSLNTDVVTWFVVSKSTVNFGTGERKGLIETSTSFSASTWGTFEREFNNTTSGFYNFGRNTSTGVVFSYTDISTSAQNNPYIINGIWRSSNAVSNYLNGTLGVAGSNANLNTFTHSKTIIGGRYAQPTEYFDGEIAEIIVFNAELNSAQIRIVHNYLSAKYGIALGTLSLYAHNSTHKHDVAGIGRVDASNEHLSAKGVGDVTITAASLDNNDYLIWGHDNAGYGENSISVPSTYSSTGGVRIDQEWRVTESGESGDVTLVFDITDISLGFDDEYELLVNLDGDGDFSDAIQISGSAGVNSISFTVPSAQLSDGSRFTLGNTKKTIISIVDGQNWNQASTWSCNCIPTNSNNVIIDNGHTVTVSDQQGVESLTVNATGELIVDSNSDFEITGDVVSNGTFTVNSPNIITIDGSAAQDLAFSGTVSFDTLLINNAAGVDLSSGSFTFSGVLYATTGDVNFNGNNVTFLSSASGMGSIGPVGGSASISGLTSVSSQRFISAGVAGFREVGFPFASSFKLLDWDDEIKISGPGFTDGCSFTGNGQCYTSAKVYNGTKMVGITNLDSVINAGTGVDIYLGDNLNTWSAKVLTTSKSLNLSNSVDISINNGWNFIANPFLSPIDFDRVTLNGSIGNYFYIYDAQNDWQYWDGDGQSSSTSALDSGIIAPYQGFWVFNSGGVTTLTVDQSSKAPTAANPFVKSQVLSAESEDFTVQIYSNEFGLKSNMSLNIEGNNQGFKELVKMPNNGRAINIHTVNREGELSTRADYTDVECVDLPIYFDIANLTSFEFTFNNLPEGYIIYLKDKELKHLTLLNSGDKLNFEGTGNINLNERFELKIVKLGSCAEDDLMNELKVNYSNSIVNLYLQKPIGNSEVKIYNMQGQLVFNSQVISSNAYQVSMPCELNSGVYIVTLEEDNGSVMTTKIVSNK
ncbi:MAG: T9SS type A sorting domain-containing protein [Flavobacteriales bacterium]|nr:T9SS type A sorting domain-containing protein [Flavobacteriales bacterium]